MKAEHLCVVCRPNEDKDTMGAEMPWQTYSYACDDEGTKFSSSVTDAIIVTRSLADRVLVNANKRKSGYRIMSLADGIAQDRKAAVEMATEPVAIGLGAAIRGIKEDDYDNPVRPLYLAVKAAINDLTGKVPDDCTLQRPWTVEEILAREG